VGIAELGHQLPGLDIPDCDEGAVVARDNGFEFGVVEGERDGVLMTSLNLLLCLKEPQIDLSRARQYIICSSIE
jgi:hypothetical protein